MDFRISRNASQTYQNRFQGWNWIENRNLSIGFYQPGTDDVISGYQSEKSKEVADWAYFESNSNSRMIEGRLRSLKPCYIRIFIVWVMLTWSVCRSLYVDFCFDICLEKSSSQKCRLKTIRLTGSYKKESYQDVCII